MDHYINASEAEILSEDKGLLSDQIRRALADEITTGRLKPGTALDEQQIATRFGASRTPVREALRQLDVSGLVEIRPRRGVIVAVMTPERIMDMFETTAEVEAMCIRLATYRITPAERSQLQAMHEASAAMVAAADLNAYDEFNRLFHEAMYRSTHNQFMAEQAISIRARLAAFRRTQLRHGDRIARSHEEHGEILRAMARGDGDEAARVHACSHAQCQRCLDQLHQYFRRRRPAALVRSLIRLDIRVPEEGLSGLVRSQGLHQHPRLQGEQIKPAQADRQMAKRPSVSQMDHPDRH